MKKCLIPPRIVFSKFRERSRILNITFWKQKKISIFSCSVCIYCDNKLHFKCYYHAPAKCETIDEVLDGHCSHCFTTDLGHGGWHGVAHGKAIRSYGDIEKLKHDGKYWRYGKREQRPLDVLSQLEMELTLNNQHLEGQDREAAKEKVEKDIRAEGRKLAMPLPMVRRPKMN